MITENKIKEAAETAYPLNSSDNFVFKKRKAFVKGAKWSQEQNKWISVTEMSIKDLPYGLYWVETKKKKEIYLYELNVNLNNIHERNVWLTRFSRFSIPVPPIP